MNEPWNDTPIIWKVFCEERKVYFNSKEIQLLFNNTRSMKEEFEWFKKGFISGEINYMSRGRSVS